MDEGTKAQEHEVPFISGRFFCFPASGFLLKVQEFIQFIFNEVASNSSANGTWETGKMSPFSSPLKNSSRDIPDASQKTSVTELLLSTAIHPCAGFFSSLPLSLHYFTHASLVHFPNKLFVPQVFSQAYFSQAKTSHLCSMIN